MKLKAYAAALLVVAVLSPLWIMPFSTPVLSDVVVVMHHDRAVNTAVRTITANDPNVRVLEYGSLDYALTMHRVVGRVVWVSHGSKTGILAGSQRLSWRTFSSRTEMTPGKDIVLACDSGAIDNYVPESTALGIDGFVDATLGGLLAAYLLRPHELLLGQMWSRLSQLVSGQAFPQLLAPFNIQLSNLWVDWTGIHGKMTVSANFLDFLLYACMALVVGVVGNVCSNGGVTGAWDAIGIVLDCVDISFGNPWLDWIWPVLIKPFLHVLIIGALGVLNAANTLIGATISVILEKAFLYLLEFLTTAIIYAISHLVGYFLQIFLGEDNWLMHAINVILMPVIKDKINGPIARTLALKLGGKLHERITRVLEELGVHVVVSILIAGLEATFDWFTFTYASGFTVGATISF